MKDGLVSILRRIVISLRRRAKLAFVLRKARSQSIKNVTSVNGKKLLVICYGNIYRSPYIEKKLKESLDASIWFVRSVGLYEKADRPSPPEYVKLALDRGIDLTRHRSNIASSEDIDWADLLIIMDRKNWVLLNEQGWAIESKLVWIGSCFEGKSVEIQDPYGLQESSISGIVDYMDRAVEGFVGMLTRR